VLQLQLTLELPLRGSSPGALGRGVQGSTSAPPSLQALLRWQPVRASGWFAQLTLYRYLRPDRQQPWHPDFSYAFGYDDWHPGSWSLFYANYTGTRLQPDAAAGEHRFNFPEGQWTLAYRYALPERLHPLLLVGDGDQANCNAAVHLVPRYVDNTDGRLRRLKKSFSAGCRYARASGWYLEAAVFAYPQGGQQQPWDPDFTYGFGWQNAGPGTLSLKYNNYSGNRFPGRARGPGEGTLRRGSVGLSWMTQW
jgi:hypothetical protein